MQEQSCWTGLGWFFCTSLASQTREETDYVCWASKMTQQMKPLPCTAEDLNVTPGTHVKSRRALSPQSCLLTSTWLSRHVCTPHVTRAQLTVTHFKIDCEYCHRCAILILYGDVSFWNTSKGARDYLDLRAPFTFDQSSWETSEVYMSGHKRLRSFRKEG